MLKKERTSAQIATIMALLTLSTKLIGFVREMLTAAFYGTSYVVDTLNIAGSIPSMIFAGIIGATATSFIPTYSNTYEKDGEEAANLFTSRVINILLIVSFISSLIGIAFSNQIVTLFTMPDNALLASANGIFEKVSIYLTHGWTGEKAALASFYVSITFSFTLFTSISGILDGYLKYKNIFISPMLSTFAISFFSIAFLLIANQTNRPALLVFGSFAGQIVRTVIMMLIARHKKYRYKPDFRFTVAVKQILVLAVPVFLGSTASQINLFINKTLASGLVTGSIAALGYADLLIALFTGLSSSIIGTILYPKLVQAHTLSEKKRFSEVFSSGAVIILIAGIPFSMGAFLYNDVIVHIIYFRGAFNEESLRLTSTAFLYYSLGLVFSMLQGYLVSGGFYSRHDTKTPLFTGVIAVAVNVVSNLILVKFFAHGGLALGWSISGIVSVILSVVMLRKKSPGVFVKGLPIKITKIFIASVISVGLTRIFYLMVSGAFFMPRTVLLFITVLIAAGIYLLILRAFKIEELIHIKLIFKS